MDFNDAAVVDSCCYSMRLSDWPRAQNRARINNLFNGFPPYTETEVKENGIEINVNNLSGTKLAHDARQQFYGAFMKPGNFFTCKTDYGPRHKRQEYSTIVTKEINKIMKRSPIYFETFRSKFAQNVLHGIGPCSWDNRDSWCPDALGVEDVFMPSGTLLTMKNLPYFAIHRSYSSEQLRRLTTGPNVDPGWNVPMVNRARKWVDEQVVNQMGTQWPEIWSPEKMAERLKSDGGYYASDNIPSVEVWDFYFYNDEGKEAGWNRRMILDCWSAPDEEGKITRGKGLDIKGEGDKSEFLYNPGKRKYGSKISEIISFQFADLSAVAPFRYHSVRSLGFMVYAQCHLENRLHCKFNEAVFENLMMYMRVKSLDEAERALKIELVSKGIIDETVQFLNPTERWQVNHQLAELGIQHNSRIIQENSSSYVQNQNFSRDRTEKTKFQVMAEVNAMTALISAGLLQAYKYQEFEYYEDFRRFCKKNSRDVDVRTFRNCCLKQGVPEEVLVPEAWELESERVLGAGNKTLEMQIADMLMQYRHLYDPEPQREILRRFTLSVTDDPGLTDSLTPMVEERVSRWTSMAQVAIASIMEGVRVEFPTGSDHIQICESWLFAMKGMIDQVNQMGGMASLEKIVGLNNLAQHIDEQIKLIAQNPNEKQRVKIYSDALGKMANEIKGFEQRLMEQMAAQQQQNGHDPELQAKLQAEIIKATAKAANTRDAHGQRTAQRQIAWEAEQVRKQEQHNLEMEQEMQSQAVTDQVEGAKAISEIERETIKTASEIQNQNKKASASKPTEA